MRDVGFFRERERESPQSLISMLHKSWWNFSRDECENMAIGLKLISDRGARTYVYTSYQSNGFPNSSGPNKQKKALFLYPLDHFKCASCRRCFCIDLRAHVNLSLSLTSLLFSFFYPNGLELCKQAATTTLTTTRVEEGGGNNNWSGQHSLLSTSIIRNVVGGKHLHRPC